MCKCVVEPVHVSAPSAKSSYDSGKKEEEHEEEFKVKCKVCAALTWSHTLLRAHAHHY